MGFAAAREGVDAKVVGRVGAAAFRELDGCWIGRGVEADDCGCAVTGRVCCQAVAMAWMA